MKKKAKKVKKEKIEYATKEEFKWLVDLVIKLTLNEKELSILLDKKIDTVAECVFEAKKPFYKFWK